MSCLPSVDTTQQIPSYPCVLQTHAARMNGLVEERCCDGKSFSSGSARSRFTSFVSFTFLPPPCMEAATHKLSLPRSYFTLLAQNQHRVSETFKRGVPRIWINVFGSHNFQGEHKYHVVGMLLACSSQPDDLCCTLLNPNKKLHFVSPSPKMYKWNVLASLFIFFAPTLAAGSACHPSTFQGIISTTDQRPN